MDIKFPTICPHISENCLTVVDTTVTIAFDIPTGKTITCRTAPPGPGIGGATRTYTVPEVEHLSFDIPCCTVCKKNFEKFHHSNFLYVLLIVGGGMLILLTMFNWIGVIVGLAILSWGIYGLSRAENNIGRVHYAGLKFINKHTIAIDNPQYAEEFSRLNPHISVLISDTSKNQKN